MKKMISTLCLVLFLMARTYSQNTVNWTPRQLLEPAQLAGMLQGGNKPLPVIISIGPGAIIPHSIPIGSVATAEGIQKLRSELKNIPGTALVVIYCGCCPFEHCPNVRPAIDVLNEMNFTNFKLLNLSHNIKTDWINKGFPVLSP